MSDQDVTAMTDRDLEANLLTVDYRGATFKRKCLDEYLRRKVQEEIEKNNTKGSP